MKIKSLPFTGTTDEAGDFVIPFPSDFIAHIGVSIDTNDGWFARVTYINNTILINISSYNFIGAEYRTFSGTVYYF